MKPTPLRCDGDRITGIGHRRVLMPEGACAYCDANRRDLMMPPHTASERCESGKRSHCSCEVCF